MSTQEQLAELMYIPKWMDNPMYIGGFPMRAESLRIVTVQGQEPRSIHERIIEYYQQCMDEKGELLFQPPLSQEDFEVLRQWVIYYLHAPIWAMVAVPLGFNQLQAEAFAIANWQQLQDVAHKALDFGLDPLS